LRVFGRLLHYLAPEKARLGLAFVLALLGIVAELARLWPIKVVVDYGLTGRPLPSWLAVPSEYLLGVETPQGILIWSVASAAVIVAGSAALSLAVLYVTTGVSQRLVYRLSLDVFGRLQRLSLAYHGRHPLGDLLQRVGGDVYVICYAISDVALPATVSLLFLVGMFAIMVSLDLTLALLAFAVVPLLGASLFLFSKPMDTTAAREFEAQGSLMALVEQSLSAIKAIQGFAREAYVQRKLEERGGDVGRAHNAAIRVSGGFQEVTNVVTGLAAAALLGLGGMRVLAGQLSLGDLLVFSATWSPCLGPSADFRIPWATPSRWSLAADASSK
jgi:ATP-binding cassette subfamily B protein